MGEPTMTPCVQCGRVPTREETIRRQVGLVFVQRWSTVKQPLCREHGEQLASQYLRKTLVQGWWGLISFFANIVSIGLCISAKSKYRALDEPRQPGGYASSANGAVAVDPSPRAEAAMFEPAAPAPAPPGAPAGGVPAGWYPDPAQRFEHRWHDGRNWTANVAHHGQQYEDPIPAG